MIKLAKILTELLNTYQVEAYMLKITIVRNITPEDYKQPYDSEYTSVNIKFITRGDAKVDMEKIKQDILTSDMAETDLRIPGVKSFKFRLETLHRL